MSQVDLIPSVGSSLVADETGPIYKFRLYYVENVHPFGLVSRDLSIKLKLNHDELLANDSRLLHRDVIYMSAQAIEDLSEELKSKGWQDFLMAHAYLMSAEDLPTKVTDEERSSHVQDFKKAYEYFTLAAQKGLTFATFYLGFCSQHGIGINPDYINAFGYYSQSAFEHDIAAAQYYLGFFYENLDQQFKDLNLAFKLYEQAAQSGYPQAQDKLAEFYMKGLGGTQKNTVLSLEWRIKAAESGLSGAQEYMARSYMYGVNVEKNYNEAIRYWYLASEQGNKDAVKQIEACYREGLRTSPQAVSFFNFSLQTANQGHVPARESVGYCYMNGLGVEISHKKAIIELSVAKLQGSNYANFLLAYIYALSDEYKDSEKALEFATEFKIDRTLSVHEVFARYKPQAESEFMPNRVISEGFEKTQEREEMFDYFETYLHMSKFVADQVNQRIFNDVHAIEDLREVYKRIFGKLGRDWGVLRRAQLPDVISFVRFFLEKLCELYEEVIKSTSPTPASEDEIKKSFLDDLLVKKISTKAKAKGKAKKVVLDEQKSETQQPISIEGSQISSIRDLKERVDSFFSVMDEKELRLARKKAKNPGKKLNK